MIKINDKNLFLEILNNDCFHFYVDQPNPIDLIELNRDLSSDSFFEIDENDEFDNYFRIRDKVNANPDRLFTSWFYGLGNIYLYTMFKDENIVTDRHFLSNYAWSETDDNTEVYDLLVKKLGFPDLTVILYADETAIFNRLRSRDEHDSDLDKVKKAKKKDKKGKQPVVAIPAECKGWLTDAQAYTYKTLDAEVIALPSDIEALHAMLADHLYLIKAGITLAEVKGRDALPAHDLAMSTALRTDAFARCELSYLDALRYLRREAIALPSDMPRGFVIVTYRNIPLGFVKNIGNRANNLYPSEWRIRSGHLPEKEVLVV